jgi:coatomer subunit beta'
MVWNINTPVRNFALEGHEGGVNCVEYFPGGDKPYLISGSDDNTVRVWDYQTKACIQTLSTHNHYVTCVAFHPDLPLVFTGSEDETICMFSTQTWRMETTQNYGMGRAWCISVKPKCNKVALGFDRGLLVLKVGKEDPVMSMDGNGKIFFAQNNDIFRLDIKTSVDKEVADGEFIQLPAKEVDSCSGMPKKILHGPNGQFVAVLFEDDEYTVNSTLAWRSKCTGHAIAFVWGDDSGTFAVLENSYTLKTFKNFKLKETVKLDGSADTLFGGPVLGVRVDGSVCFYDWETLRIVRQITEPPTEIVWSDSGELCAIVTDSATFVLKYNPTEVAEALASGVQADEDGFEIAFSLVEEIEVKMRRAMWVGDCLLYVNRSDRICYYIGGETTSLAVIQRGFSLLGYVAKENRLFCMDKDRNVIAYQLFTSVIDFKTAVVREDLAAAAEILPRIPESMRQKVAEFLQVRGHLRMAMDVTTDPDHRFDLAIEIGDITVAMSIAKQRPSAGKWKLVGDLAMEQAQFSIAVDALRSAHDFNGLLLYYSAIGDAEAIAALGREAQSLGRSNVAFTCYFMAGDHDACIDLLLATNRYAEAAFAARTYRQHRICEIVDKWRMQLAGIPRLREAIADPAAYPNLFPTVDLTEAQEEEEEEPAAVEEPVAQPPQASSPKAASTSSLSPKVTSAMSSPRAESAESPKRAQAPPAAQTTPVPAISPSPETPPTPANSFASPVPVAPPPSMVKPPAPDEPIAGGDDDADAFDDKELFGDDEAATAAAHAAGSPKAASDTKVDDKDLFGSDDDDWNQN